MGRQKRAAGPEVPDPEAYTERFLQQDYGRVLSSLQQDPGQVRLSFGSLNTTLLHAACYDARADIVEQLIPLGADVNARGRQSGRLGGPSGRTALRASGLE